MQYDYNGSNTVTLLNIEKCAGKKKSYIFRKLRKCFSIHQRHIQDSQKHLAQSAITCFKVNNRNNRNTVVNFEQVNARWEVNGFQPLTIAKELSILDI